jgi:hypothetical protein
MKDLTHIVDDESKQDKWNRAVDLFIESVLKPDAELRNCAHDQKCYTELMEIRKNIIDYLLTNRWH